MGQAAAGVLSQNSGIRLVPDSGAGCRFYTQSFVYAQSFGGQSLSSRPTLLPPLQPWFVKETEFFSAKAQKLKNSAKPNSGTVCRFSMEGSCIGFWKSKENSTFCKVVKQKGETFWHRKSHLLCKRLVPKLQNSAKPNSGDSLPVLALECFSAYGTGGLISEFSAS